MKGVIIMASIDLPAPPLTQYGRSYFIEATSEDASKEPTLLINTGNGPIDYIEVRSQMAGSNKYRIVFQDGHELMLEGSRAQSFMSRLAENGMWKMTPEEGK